MILTLHLLIRQEPVRVSVPSAASPYFLLVAIIEVTLFMSLFPSIWIGHLWAHSMRRWRPLLEPLPLRTPTWVLFDSPLPLGVLWRLPLITCRSSFWSLGMLRTGSSSAASLGCLIFHHLSSATAFIGTGPGSRWKVGRIINSLAPQKLYLIILESFKEYFSLNWPFIWYNITKICLRLFLAKFPFFSLKLKFYYKWKMLNSPIILQNANMI